MPKPKPWLVRLALSFPLHILASAHTRSGEAAGFLSGLWHPVSGLDHLRGPQPHCNHGAVSAMALGFAVFREARPKLWIAALVVGFFAVFHGHAHGTELAPGTDALLYSVGLVIATGSLHAAGIALGVAHRWPAGRFSMRTAGALIALTGVVYLWQVVAAGRA